MSELRQDPTTKAWVIMTPERASRPQQRPEKGHVDEPPNDIAVADALFIKGIDAYNTVIVKFRNGYKLLRGG